MSLPHAYEPILYADRREPFYVLEGVSGIGKSTLTELLRRRLGASSLHTLHTPHSGWSPVANGRLRPLPQFAFYLSGVLHAADSVRQARTISPVVADRYVSSVIACHSAVHRVALNEVRLLLGPFLPYLETPDHTFYLRSSEQVLRDRMTAKAADSNLTSDDAELFTVPGRLARLLDNFEAVADEDPTAVVLNTDGKTPDELADWIINHVEAGRA
ncbi:thymidylate kinase [Streptomyces sp. LX-29]|uniref:dTMP kinase n=1 Tax=Streptomyces sp. LX-29 TaxID=2900152 RepID=UPI00240DF652|nr:thymidylate kinase [Streptomyces sp. LX-29]WFB09422.1 thymidylate kinase [Streptomyces sp. LX-29]